MNKLTKISRNCCVVGCTYQSIPLEKCTFYRFPSDPIIRDVWITFTRRGSDFNVTKSTYICENHFDPSCFIHSKSRLVKNAVPTILYRNNAGGETERVELTFNHDVMHYLEEDILLNPLYDRDKREKDLIDKKQQKLDEVKNLCRFCLEDKNNENLIEIRKLRDYNISPTEVFELVGIRNNEIFSKSACEECFQQIFIFDGYRKRCRKAQNTIINEIKAIEHEISEISGNDSWMKTEEYMNFNEKYNKSIQEKFEEITEIPQKFEEISHNILEIMVKQENTEVESLLEDDSDEEFYNEQNSTQFTPQKQKNNCSIFPDLEEIINSTTKKAKIEINVLSKDEAAVALKNLTQYCEKDNPVIENLSLAPFPAKCSIYECFFCRVRYTGKKLYKAHDCPMKEITCEISACSKKFTSVGGFNSHLRKVHKLKTFKKHFCRFCKVSKITTNEEFRVHVSKCEAAVIKTNEINPVTCEMCAKICPNPKAYSIHLMFHKTGKKSFETDTNCRKVTKSIFICETCGKEFAKKQYLNYHMNNVHNKNIYASFSCDLCGKIYPSKQGVRKHITTVHLIQLSPCSICDKVFRNLTLLKAHNKLLHDQSRRIHFCLFCPDKPPYNTAVALRRHQEANHGMGKRYNCDICSKVFKGRNRLYHHKRKVHTSSKAYNKNAGQNFSSNNITSKYSNTNS